MLKRFWNQQLSSRRVQKREIGRRTGKEGDFAGEIFGSQENQSVSSQILVVGKNGRVLLILGAELRLGACIPERWKEAVGWREGASWLGSQRLNCVDLWWIGGEMPDYGGMQWH